MMQYDDKCTLNALKSTYYVAFNGGGNVTHEVQCYRSDATHKMKEWWSLNKNDYIEKIKSNLSNYMVDTLGCNTDAHHLLCYDDLKKNINARRCISNECESLGDVYIFDQNQCIWYLFGNSNKKTVYFVKFSMSQYSCEKHICIATIDLNAIDKFSDIEYGDAYLMFINSLRDNRVRTYVRTVNNEQHENFAWDVYSPSPNGGYFSVGYVNCEFTNKTFDVQQYSKNKTNQPLTPKIDLVACLEENFNMLMG